MIRNRKSSIAALMFAATALFLSACNKAPTQAAEGPETAMAISNHSTIQGRWEQDLDTALERAQAEDKTILVTFYADWCVWCKRMETTTLRDASVATMLTDRVIPLRMNVEEEGLEFSDDYGVRDLPTTVMLDADGTEIGRITGYFPPTGFMERVEIFLPRG